MPTRITVPLEAIHFPIECGACGATPAATFPLEIRRGIDLLFVRQVSDIRLAVPVCVSCYRKRRWAGWLALPLLLLAMVVASLFAMDLNFKGHNGPALALLILILALMLFTRLGLDDYLTWQFIGVHAVWDTRRGPCVRLTTKRLPFLEALQTVNPFATREGA